MPHELLILSDLHLGGALRPPIDFATLRNIARLDREVERLLLWFDARPIVGADGEPRPWTLVLNGDTLDFLHMGLTPDDMTDPDEQLYGANFFEARSRWKLEQMAAYHRRAFRAFARFIAAGHRVVFVAGNHDADLVFPGVQADLKQMLAVAAADPEAAAERVEFAPWFYREDGRVWFEHGHRFDPYNTFPDPLAPIPMETAAGARRLAPTFVHWGLRYFVNRVRDFPMHDVETWGPLDFARWIWNKASMGFARMALVWAGFLSRYVRDTARARARRGHAVRRASRRALLRRLAQTARMPVDRLMALDALHLPHVGASLGRLALALYFDRIALAAGVVMALSATLPFMSGWFAPLATVCVVLGATAWGWRRLNQMRPKADTHTVLGRVVDRVGRLANAPVVIFGHTHRPVLRDMGRTRWLNPGSWEHVGRHRAGSGPRHAIQPTFAVITGHGRDTEARLMAWSRARREPEVLQGRPVTFHPLASSLRTTA